MGTRCTKNGKEWHDGCSVVKWYEEELEDANGESISVRDLPISGHALPDDWSEGLSFHGAEAKAVRAKELHEQQNTINDEYRKRWVDSIKRLQKQINDSKSEDDSVYVVGIYRNSDKSGLILSLEKGKELEEENKSPDYFPISQVLESGNRPRLTLHKFRRHLDEIQNHHPVSEVHLIFDEGETT